MGKWDRRYYRPRPRRRSFKDYDWSPPRDEPCPDPETEEWQDNVPMWEKKFCYLVGQMPWRKILSVQNFMHSYPNIFSWDDSAGKEAFLDAKKRFWDGINDLPSETQLPDPDMYIDEIDWNPNVDTEWVRELEHAYFNPDDNYYLPSECSLKGNDRWPEETNDPWERGYAVNAVNDATTGWKEWDNQPGDGGWRSEVKDKTTGCPSDDEIRWECGHVQPSVVEGKILGWDQCHKSVNDTAKLAPEEGPWERQNAQNNLVRDSIWDDGGQWDNSVNYAGILTKKDDLWERNCAEGDMIRDSAWGDGGQWGMKSQNHMNMSKNWNSGNNTWKNEDKKQEGYVTRSNSWNQMTGGLQKPYYQNNSHKPQCFGALQGSRAPNGRGVLLAPNGLRNYKWEVEDTGTISRGRRQFIACCRKREGTHQYVNGSGPRIQGSVSYSSRNWNGGNNKRANFGGKWC